MHNAMADLDRLRQLDTEIVSCFRCPRLVEWRELVAKEKRRSFEHEEYWGRPVPNFGDPQADRLIVGLAPAAHGGNRTGRFFTGDRSGEWLFAALHRAGIANQPTSTYREDGLQLKGALITAIIHCAPPGNKPLPGEVANCREYLARTLETRSWKAILCLGSVAWDQIHRLTVSPPARFVHAATNHLATGPLCVASYHPSQQNTFTGKLTEAMLDDAINLWLSG